MCFIYASYLPISLLFEEDQISNNREPTRLDTCDSIVYPGDITFSAFLGWNPAVGNSTCDHLLPGYDVCVGGGYIGIGAGRRARW